MGQRLYYITKNTRWSKGIGAELPEAYKKFWREWKLTQPIPVHYVKQEGSYKRNKRTGEVKPVQNTPLPLIFPKEFNQTILGGEAIVQGFKQKHRHASKAPHYWFPTLKQSIVYSEILDKYMKTIVTNRTIHLIHEHKGFDHYLLKSRACDLKSELAVKLKRLSLLALADKSLYPNDPEKKEEIYAKYKDYLSQYTREEIEWYGLTWPEACKKWKRLREIENCVKPLKLEYRNTFIATLQFLKESGYQISETTTVSSILKNAAVERTLAQEKV